MRVIPTYAFDNRAEVDSLQFDVRFISDRSDFDPDQVAGGIGGRFDMFWVGVYPSGELDPKKRLGYAVITPDLDDATAFTVALQFRVEDFEVQLAKRIEEYFAATQQFVQQMEWVRAVVAKM